MNDVTVNVQGVSATGQAGHVSARGSMMHTSLITPEKIFFEGDAEMITMPGTEGEFGVLTGHMPFISTLKPGVITIDLPNKEKKKIVVLSGIAEVVPDHCLVLAETAEDITALTPQDIVTRLAAARKLADDAVTDAEKKDSAYKLAVAEALAQAA